MSEKSRLVEFLARRGDSRWIGIGGEDVKVGLRREGRGEFAVVETENGNVAGAVGEQPLQAVIGDLEVVVGGAGKGVDRLRSEIEASVKGIERTVLAGGALAGADPVRSTLRRDRVR